MNILLTVSYDGTNYFGWQRQKNNISVQQRLEEALSELMRKNIEVRGASRTDTGVHALGQAALLKTETSIPIGKLSYAVNSFLPDDIAVTGARLVSDEFHPQYSVIKKTYRYKILNAEFRNPMLRNYSEFVRQPLDIEKMREACGYFIGTYDFAAFRASGSAAKTTVRTIFDLSVERNKDIVDIMVTGNGFLYNMVRIIAGTLIYVGTDKFKPSFVKEIIASKDRIMAGKTAGASGLTLMKIYYKE
ncbi:MAG: tRNA pseudouridine(38-40) synthase TruA [Clostridiales bacterium]|jgi:tRNA pseudouridine38-40 synthase|nr:tRNA pseudouridine(38-40) synthase TruA [Clostridiales bacterium]